MQPGVQGLDNSLMSPTHDPRPAEIAGISPFFIVRHVPSSLAFYRDRLGFEVTFEGPAPDDIFFGIVRRGGAQILLKDVGVDPGAELHARRETRHRTLGRFRDRPGSGRTRG